MQVGMVGLGRMGANLARRLARAGHEVTGFDADPQAGAALPGEGIGTAGSLEELAGRLAAPRVVWLMLPAPETGATLEHLAPLLGRGDVVVDGGNGDFRETRRRAEGLAERGIDQVDVGTSGGVHGLERGYCLMIGGETGPVERLEPLFRALAPGVDAAARTAPAQADPTPAEHGYLHCGGPGAGHFVKMVHNGIEYGLMAAYAEGLNVLRSAATGPADAPPSESYSYDLDVTAIAELWRRGSVVSSWLLDLTAQALSAPGGLDAFEGRVADSGEGRWAVRTAVELGVPAHVLSAALYGRFESRGEADFAFRVLSAMRAAFGGHREPPA